MVDAKAVVFIYGLAEPDGRIRYIGKAINPFDRYKAHLREAEKRDYRKCRWIRSLRRNGIRPMLILLECVTSENWEEREMFWILKIGDDLVNHTLGGEGGWMDEQSMEKAKRSRADYLSKDGVKKAISESVSNLWKNPDYRARQSRSHAGKKQPQEVVEKRIKCFRGKPWSENKRRGIMAAIHKNSVRVERVDNGRVFINARQAAIISGDKFGVSVTTAMRRGTKFDGTFWRKVGGQCK